MTENIEIVLKEFEDAVIKYSDALKEGKHKVTNKYYDQIICIISLLGRNNQVDVLKCFLDHTMPVVRSFAATYLLPIDEKMAIKVLKDVIKAKDSLTSFETQMVIEEWKHGNLKPYLTKLINGDKV